MSDSRGGGNWPNNNNNYNRQRAVRLFFFLFVFLLFLGGVLLLLFDARFLERDEIERKFSLHKEGPRGRSGKRASLSLSLSLVLSRSFLSFFAKEKRGMFFVFCARGFCLF